MIFGKKKETVLKSSEVLKLGKRETQLFTGTMGVLCFKKCKKTGSMKFIQFTMNSVFGGFPSTKGLHFISIYYLSLILALKN